MATDPAGRRPEVWNDFAAVRAGFALDETIVLVPTMGDLHEGHLDLVRAGGEIGSVVVSIFVNPTQFAPGEDFDRYPRRLESDVERLAALGVRGVFAPAVETVYPPGESTRVDAGAIARPLCGRHREGHFAGVATVCTKLFAGIAPQVAVFGEKDAQQCLLLHRVVRDLCFDVDLCFVPTRREDDGLAMSSRNRYLRDEERHAAGALSRGLSHGEDLLRAGERDARTIESAVIDLLERDGVRRDYAELRRVPDLETIDRADGRVLLAVAGHVGRARLIDNRCFHVGAGAVWTAPLLDQHTPDAVHRRWRPVDPSSGEGNP